MQENNIFDYTDFTSLSEICAHYGAEFLKKKPIAPYTSFKIGGNCNIIEINGEKTLVTILKHCKHSDIPYRILGRGSNVLISDRGLKGVVLVIGNNYKNVDFDKETVKCHAGASLNDICLAAALHSLSGFEFAYGIPGSAGGALYMNAGAFGGEMANVIESCTFVDEDGEVGTMNKEDMGLLYRHSVFAERNVAITKLILKLQYGERSDIKAKMDEVKAARKEKQPLNYPSAGSTFKRPPPQKGKTLYAAQLIEECGLKGRSVGGAAVSEKHSGFIVNRDNASFDDVVGLIDIVKREVLEKTGVALECEVKIWE